MRETRINCARRALRWLVVLVVLGAPALRVAGQAWIPQGPRPTRKGQVENIAGGEVAGAIRTVVAHPTDPQIVFVGTVNGGVWRTMHARDSSPVWEPETDSFESLSIGALAFDPTDVSHKTVLAGSGRFSSLGSLGGGRVGLLRTVDGGASWSPLDGSGQLVGLNISGLAPRGRIIVLSVNDADDSTRAGLWRSATAGSAWTQVSGAGDGLPKGACATLASDPTDLKTLFTNAGTAGVFKSGDTGATWREVSNGPMRSALSKADNVRVSVGAGGRVFVAVDVNGQLHSIFCSRTGGQDWAAMDLPSTPEGGAHPGTQGGLHLSMVADPVNDGIVYVGGDRQPLPFPNSIGAHDYSGRLFRGNASLSSGHQWVHLTHSDKLGASGGGTAHSSAPHADSRGMAIDAGGDLLEVDDGGIYRRTLPLSNKGDWVSMNGNLQIAEFHAVAWDANCHIVVGGAQDGGTPEQEYRASPGFPSVSTGDGGVVAVDSAAAPGRSIRYSSYWNLKDFRRQVYDASNNLQSDVYPPLAVLEGGATLVPQFYTPLRLDTANPHRLVIGAKNAVYESDDEGDSIREIGPGLVVNGNGWCPMAYGAADNPDMLYLGVGAYVFRRSAASPAPLTASPMSLGGRISGIAIDPAEGLKAYAATSSQVFRTQDGGQTWIDISGNLGALHTGSVQCVAYSTHTKAGAVLVGSDKGVVSAAGPDFETWQYLGVGLPKAPVYHLEYSAADSVILAGTLGRGAWTLALPPPPASGDNSGSSTRRWSAEERGDERPVYTSNRDWSFSRAGTFVPLPQGSVAQVTLSPGVIVDEAKGRLYVMSPEGAINAIELETGQRLWATTVTAKPIGVSGNSVIAQVEPLRVPNEFRIVAVNSETGGIIASGSSMLPPSVRSSISESLEGHFVATARPSAEGPLIDWQFVQPPLKAIPPGTKTDLPGSTDTSPGRLDSEVTSGTFRMSMATGSLSNLGGDAGQPTTLAVTGTRLMIAEPTRGNSEKEFLSADGLYIATSRRRDDGADFETYEVTVYNRSSKVRVGKFRSHVSVLSFVVVGSRAVFESRPYVRRLASGQLVEEPLKIRAISLKTGVETWSQPVRDIEVRGPVPP